MSRLRRQPAPSAWYAVRALIRVSKLLYCKYDDCRIGYASVAGDVPSMCPACSRPAHWSTMQPEATYHEPLSPWNVSRNDRKFLKGLRISSDE